MKKNIPFLLAVAYALLLPALLPADTVVEEIIARINNQIVTRTEYIHSRDQLKQEIQQQEPANADRIFAEKQRDVLRDLIDQQLLLEKGKDLFRGYCLNVQQARILIRAGQKLQQEFEAVAIAAEGVWAERLLLRQEIGEKAVQGSAQDRRSIWFHSTSLGMTK